MKRIIKLLSYTLIAAFMLVMGTYLQACKKDKPKPPQEANLAVSLDPAPGSVTTPVVAIGATYTFNVKVDSRMPANGVTVNVVYRQDSDNQVVFSQEYTTATSPLPVSITGIPFNELGTVTVVVTSKSNATNTQTKTFKLVRK